MRAIDAAEHMRGLLRERGVALAEVQWDQVGARAGIRAVLRPRSRPTALCERRSGPRRGLTAVRERPPIASLASAIGAERFYFGQGDY
jgi:hypothetical protein